MFDNLDDLEDAPTAVAPPDPRIALPEMTRQEASWYASIAEKRAEVAHRQGHGSAADEQSRAAEAGAQALAEHAAETGGAVFGGITFHRPSAYGVFAVQQVEKLFADEGLLPIEQDGLLMVCFENPRLAYQTVQKRDKQALRDACLRVMLTLDDPDTINAAKDWCLEQFALLNGVKKPSTPAPAPAAAGSPTPDRSAASPTPSTPPLNNTGTPPTANTPGSAPSSTC